jgi:hypothetical protein
LKLIRKRWTMWIKEVEKWGNILNFWWRFFSMNGEICMDIMLIFL